MSGAPIENEGFARRARRRLWLGAILGTVVGGIVGLLIGSIAFESARAMWASIAAGAIFIGGVSTFIAGISSLEPPRPGRELSPGATDPTPDHARQGSDDDADPLVVEEPIHRPEGASREQGETEGRSR
jgi:hypothetical protein